MCLADIASRSNTSNIIELQEVQTRRIIRPTLFICFMPCLIHLIHLFRQQLVRHVRQMSLLFKHCLILIYTYTNARVKKWWMLVSFRCTVFEFLILIYTAAANFLFFLFFSAFYNTIQLIFFWHVLNILVTVRYRAPEIFQIGGPSLSTCNSLLPLIFQITWPLKVCWTFMLLFGLGNALPLFYVVSRSNTRKTFYLDTTSQPYLHTE